jgi:hypothetical protein
MLTVECGFQPLPQKLIGVVRQSAQCHINLAARVYLAVLVEGNESSLQEMALKPSKIERSYSRQINTHMLLILTIGKVSDFLYSNDGVDLKLPVSWGVESEFVNVPLSLTATEPSKCSGR